MAKPKDDFFITLLNYSMERIREGKNFHIAEVTEHVKDKHTEVNIETIQMTCLGAFEVISIEGGGYPASLIGRIVAKTSHTLTLDSYFQLLEHTELIEARRSSSNAMRAALAAMAISAFLAIGSIIINLWDISL
ncbi:MAG: hypothetical protein IH872_12540 [Chloroflexi bacterium]|nr:hypothetical protein [Chloroflexota bacterium]